MLLFLFDLVVGLFYFDVEPLVVNVDCLKTNSNCTDPGLRKYSDDPGVDRLVKGDIDLLVLIFTCLIWSSPIDGLP